MKSFLIFASILITYTPVFASIDVTRLVPHATYFYLTDIQQPSPLHGGSVKLVQLIPIVSAEFNPWLGGYGALDIQATRGASRVLAITKTVSLTLNQSGSVPVLPDPWITEVRQGDRSIPNDAVLLPLYFTREFEGKDLFDALEAMIAAGKKESLSKLINYLMDKVQSGLKINANHQVSSSNHDVLLRKSRIDRRGFPSKKFRQTLTLDIALFHEIECSVLEFCRDGTRRTKRNVEKKDRVKFSLHYPEDLVDEDYKATQTVYLEGGGDSLADVDEEILLTLEHAPDGLILTLSSGDIQIGQIHLNLSKNPLGRELLTKDQGNSRPLDESPSIRVKNIDYPWFSSKAFVKLEWPQALSQSILRPRVVIDTSLSLGRLTYCSEAADPGSAADFLWRAFDIRFFWVF